MNIEMMREFALIGIHSEIGASDLSPKVQSYLIGLVVADLGGTDRDVAQAGEMLAEAGEMLAEAKVILAEMHEAADDQMCDLKGADDVLARGEMARGNLVVDRDEAAVAAFFYSDAKPDIPDKPDKPVSFGGPAKRNDDARNAIIEALRSASVPLTIRQLSEMAQLAYSKCDPYIRSMIKSGVVEAAGQSESPGHPKLYRLKPQPVLHPAGGGSTDVQANRESYARTLLFTALEQGKLITGTLRTDVAEILQCKSGGILNQFISKVQEEWRSQRSKESTKDREGRRGAGYDALAKAIEESEDDDQ